MGDMMTAEQAAEAAKGLTFEKVWAALMENRQQMQESQKEMQESRQQMQESHQQMRESQQETQKSMDESLKKMEKNISEVSKKLGKLGNSIGELTEAMFSPELWEKFAEIGLPVTRQSCNVTFTENRQVIAEADVFIENGEFAMPVEIKTKLLDEDVDEHLERMAKIRRYFDARGEKRKLIGAVAGGIVPESVMNRAHKKGLYVIIQSGDSAIIAAAPQGFKAREW